MAWDDDLLTGQRDAAGSDRGDAVLLAGPGTGKTFVLVRRVQYLVEVEHVRPEHITALTFTRAAAAEMRERLEQRLGDIGKRVRVSTLHSYALREIIREGARNLPSPVRVLGDWEERQIVVEELAQLLSRNVNEVKDDLARLADDWDTLAADGQGWEAGYADSQFLGAWRRHREVYGYTLRSELVYQLLCELRSNPSFTPSAECVVLLVDEYQDLNMCDLTTIKAISERSDAEVFATGDDDQSIYSFRHAHPAGIRGFASESYPGAGQLLMTECMRCGAEIVDLANWLIRQEPGRVDKTLESVTLWAGEVHLLRFGNQEDEAEGIAEIIDAEIDNGLKPHEILVLLKSDKNAKMSGPLVAQLEGRGHLAYLPRSRGEVDQALQTLLEYLVLASELAANDRVDDVSLRALLELVDNGIGKTRLWNLTRYCLDNRLRYHEGIERLRDNPSEFLGTGVSKLIDAADEIVDTARQLAQQEGEEFEEWLQRVCGQVGVGGGDLETVQHVAEQISLAAADDDQGPTLGNDFAQELVGGMTSIGDTLPPSVPGHVTITTMHGAKGLSAKLVVVLQAEDEVIPGDAVGMELDEARRLLYVSVTRAKEKLLISACQRRTGPQRFVGQREEPRRTLTQFLTDYALTATTASQYLACLDT